MAKVMEKGSGFKGIVLEIENLSELYCLIGALGMVSNSEVADFVDHNYKKNIDPMFFQNDLYHILQLHGPKYKDELNEVTKRGKRRWQ